MTLAGFRLQMESYRREVGEEAMSLKDSYLALDRIHALYRKFDDEERVLADHVVAEWALSEDEKVRFDASALIDDFKITTAIPALEKLAERLATSAAPGAQFELQKIGRIKGSLGARAS